MPRRLRHEFLGTMAAASEKPLAAQGALPGAPLDRHRARPVCVRDQRQRQRHRFSQRVVHFALAGTTHGCRSAATGSLTTELRDAALRAYPQYKVSWIWDARTSNQAPNQAIDIWLDRNGHKKERLFDPYTGQDLGESRPYSIQLMAWLARPARESAVRQNGTPDQRRGRRVRPRCFQSAVPCSGGQVPEAGAAASSFARNPTGSGLNWQLHNVIGLWMLPIVVHVRIGGRLCRLSGTVSNARE